MFSSAESFDIADLKRASVKMKGALQAEWQAEINSKSQTAGETPDLGALELYDDSTRAFLPRVDLTLQLNSNIKNVSYVPTLSHLQGNEDSQWSRFVISQMAC